MYDLRGKAVFTQPIQGTSTTIDVSGLAPGIYLVRLSSSRVTTVVKVVIE